MGDHRRNADVLVRPASGSHRAVAGPRTGAHRRVGRPDVRRVSPLRGFPPVRPDGAVPSSVAVVPVPRAALDDVAVPVPAARPPTVRPVAERTAQVVPAEAPDADVLGGAVLEVAGEAAADPADDAPRAVRRGRARDRRPHLLLAALVAGAVGAGAFGLHGTPGAAAGSPEVLAA